VCIASYYLIIVNDDAKFENCRMKLQKRLLLRVIIYESGLRYIKGRTYGTDPFYLLTANTCDTGRLEMAVFVSALSQKRRQLKAFKIFVMLCFVGNNLF